MEGWKQWIYGWNGERVSHLGSLERMTQDQEKDGRMRGWMEVMVVVCKKDGGKEEGARVKERDTKQEKKTFFWVIQSLYKQQ